MAFLCFNSSKATPKELYFGKEDFMKVVYIVGFSVDGNSGKKKATREKVRVWKEKIGNDNFSFYSNRFNGGVIKSLFGLLWLDLLIFTKLILVEKDYVVIQRVLFLPMSRLLFFFKGVKVISEFHADLKDEIPHLGKGRILNLILKLMVPFYNLNYTLSHGIIYNHPILKEAFDKIYKAPSIYCYNGANCKEFAPESLDVVRKSLNIKNDEIIFLFLGSISKWHGVDYLINIFNSENIKKSQNLFLYIVGAENNIYTQRLKESAQNKNIVFVEPVDTSLAKDYINASNYCLLPVKQLRISPGSPLKLYDYIACGKPVLTQANVIGYSDEVEKYNLGFSVDFTDPKKCSEAILTLVNENHDFSVNNRRLAAEVLNWENRIEEWLDFIKKIKYD